MLQRCYYMCSRYKSHAVGQQAEKFMNEAVDVLARRDSCGKLVYFFVCTSLPQCLFDDGRVKLV